MGVFKLSLCILLLIKMPELEFKVDVPPKLEPKFEAALERVVNGFIEELEFSVARDILSRSELTEEQAKELADEVKKGIARRHGVSQ